MEAFKAFLTSFPSQGETTTMFGMEDITAMSSIA